LYSGATLLFLLIANQTFCQATLYVDNNIGVDDGDCTEIPCLTIGYTIEQANDGDIIELSEGHYTESITIDKSLTINGAHETTTIIQAAETSGIAEERVITILEGEFNITLNNLTIRYGLPTGIEPGILERGGGLYATFFNSLIITNVTFYQNHAEEGGGLFSGGNPIISNVSFVENSSIGNGGGMFNSHGSPILNNVSFNNNSAHGGAGMINLSGSPILIEVFFNNNIANLYGGGLSNQMNCSPILTNIVFSENEAEYGGGVFDFFNNTQQVYKNVIFIENISTVQGGGLFSDSSSPLLINTLFEGNSAIDGGAIYLTTAGFPALTNVTLSNNFVAGNGAGIYNESSETLTINNSIIWGNTAEGEGNEIYNNDLPITISYSIYSDSVNDIIGEPNASNSFNENPLFVDSGNGDFQLMVESPGVDSGNPDTDISHFPGEPDAPLDLNNNPRVIGVNIDIGAYENQGSMSIIDITEPDRDIHLYPNPVDNMLYIL